MGRRFLVLTLAAAIAIAGQTARPAAQDTIQAAFDDLKHGGFVVIFRHGKTNAPAGAPEDKSPLDLANCADQAMLSEAGQDQARAIGRAFRSASIPVGKVLASGYCRAIEMARLAFGRVETTDALLLRNFVPVAGASVPPPWPQRVEMMKKLVATVPEGPTNTMLITHFPNVNAALGVQIDFGDAVIVKPDGQGGARLIARILASRWDSL
ncbi:MAG TPA: histidine phosphatase family protein [Xanthobacteraceae bacterium]|nr:histidine phosphatase family protein [Xanthobacteraceae bacterium]